MGILENSLAGKLSKFHIANDNLFCLLILGLGLVSTEPEEIRSVKNMFDKGINFHQKMFGDLAKMNDIDKSLINTSLLFLKLINSQHNKIIPKYFEG